MRATPCFAPGVKDNSAKQIYSFTETIQNAEGRKQMNDLDKVLSNGVETGAVPFVVGMVGNANGITYSGSAGYAAGNRCADLDTVFRIFSMTKAVGSVAAMILIDRGKLSMDTPIVDVLPSWQNLQVLDGFEGDNPILRTPKTVATVRHLATHTSGLEYEFWNGDVAKYLEVTGHPTVLTGLKASLNYPLTNDPGTRWGYGPGIDWLAQIVETIDGRRIDQFCQDEILGPLDMTSTAFEADKLADRLADVVVRGEDGRYAPMEIAPPDQPEFYGMGHALYSTAPDYMRFLRMILNKGSLDDQRIISEEAVHEMLADQMQGLGFETMHSISPLSADIILAGNPAHSFISVVHREDTQGKRSTGTQSWAGMLNTHYWVDPCRNTAAVIMTQSLPFVDPKFIEFYDAFEKATYSRE